MAVDNIDRMTALNAIVAAWTDYESLPFIMRKSIPAGQSVSFSAAHPYRGILASFGNGAAVAGLYLLKVIDSGSSGYSFAMSQATALTISYAANKYTIRNSGSMAAELFILSIIGSIEEV